MKEIRLKIAELFQIDAPSRDDAKDLAEVTAYVLKHYAFLPKPIVVTIDGDEIGGRCRKCDKPFGRSFAS